MLKCTYYEGEFKMNIVEEKEFYEKIGKINGWDFSKMKYDLVDNSEFVYFDEVNSNVDKNTILLDIGTGGGEKLINLISNDCLLKIGTDFSDEMIKAAKRNIANRNNIKVLQMNSDKILFPNDFFDIVCARHTPFNANEIYRVMKSQGKFFSEQIDEDDCLELKEMLKRGQGYNEKIKLIKKTEEEMKKEKFSDLKFFDIIQYEYYETEEDLLFLLNNTPIIPDFGKVEGDIEKFNKYVENNKSDKGIVLKRKLFGIKAIK